MTECLVDPGLLFGVLVKSLDRCVDLLILVIQREERLETRDACSAPDSSLLAIS